jgi:3-hydroxyacyl-CoA dehydrogenase
MIRQVAVLGAGTMGAQIAAHAANAGLQVLLLDLNEDQVNAALNKLQKTSPPPLFAPERVQQIEAGSFDKDLPRIRHCDWVVEAVAEDAGIK